MDQNRGNDTVLLHVLRSVKSFHQLSFLVRSTLPMKSTLFLRPCFEQKLLPIFLIIFSIITSLAALVYKNNLVHQRTSALVEHTKDVLYNTEEISSSIKELESAVR